MGATDTGKSTLARELFLSAAAPRLVVDPADSTTTNVAGAVTFSDPARIPRAATIRFVPSDPADRDAYDALYRAVFTRLFPVYVWLDEPEQAASESGFPPMVNTVVAQGRKRMIGHLTCATRPRRIMVSLRTNAKRLFVFDLPSSADRRTIADDCGIPLDQLERAMTSLPEHGFLSWDQRSKELVTCAPLSL